jgi:hypothetical protein
MPPDPVSERTEAERARRSVLLGAILGAILAALARRRRPVS